MVSITIKYTRSIDGKTPRVTINKIEGPLINEEAWRGRWNFEPTPGNGNIRIYETNMLNETLLDNKTRKLQSFFDWMSSFDLTEGETVDYQYFMYVMTHARKSLENYNKYEEEHAKEKEEFLKNWYGEGVEVL